MSATQPAQPSANASARSAAAATAAGNLKSVLERLRQTLDRLASAGGGSPAGPIGGWNPAGLGAAGMGGVASVATSGAGIGLAAAQNLANQIQQTMNATAAGFAASMAQAGKTWRSNLGSAQAQWNKSAHQAQTVFSKASHRSAQTFERYFDATIGLGINAVGRGASFSAQIARDAWKNPRGFAAGAAGSAWGFGTDFYSAWRNAHQGGLPLGGRGAVWGQAIGLGARRAWATAQAMGAHGLGAFANMARVGNTPIPHGDAFDQWWAQRSHYRGKFAAQNLARGARRHGKRARRFGVHLGRHAARRAIMARRAFGGAQPFLGAMARSGMMAAGSAGLGIAAGVAGVAGTALSVIGTAVSIGASIVGTGVAIAALAKVMKDHAEHKVVENRYLSRYNGGLANAYMALDMGDLRRDIDMAHRTGGSSSALVASVNGLRDNWQESNVFFQEVSNRIGIMGASFVGEIGKALIPGFQAGGNLLNQIDPNGAVSGGAAAGLAAALMSLLTDPANFNPLNMMGPAQAAAKKAATAQANLLMNPPQMENPAGQLLHTLANPPGPVLKRPTPNW